MENFDELSFDGMQDVKWGSGSPDYWSNVVNAIGQFGCDLKNAAYDYPIRAAKHGWADSIGKVEL